MTIKRTIMIIILQYCYLCSESDEWLWPSKAPKSRPSTELIPDKKSFPVEQNNKITYCKFNHLNTIYIQKLTCNPIVVLQIWTKWTKPKATWSFTNYIFLSNASKYHVLYSHTKTNQFINWIIETEVTLSLKKAKAHPSIQRKPL